MLSGLELKLHRVKLGLKVKDISEYLQVHYTYISKLEANKQRIPKYLYDKWVEFLSVEN